MKKRVFISFSLSIFLLVVSCNTNKINFNNLDFSKPCESMDSLCDWQISYTARSKFNFIELNENKNDFALQMVVDNGVGYVEQSFSPQEMREECILKFSAEIKTEKLVGKGAGLTIGVYDVENTLLQSVDMGYGDFNYLKNTSDWTKKEIETVLPRETKTIKIGLITYGTGNAYFDNASVNFIQISKSNPSELAIEYVDKAADSIMKNSLLRDEIDIKPIKEKAYKIAGNAKTGKDTYLAIQYMLQATNDHHAFFMPAEVRKKWEGTDSTENKDNSTFIKYSNAEIKNQMGYLNIPGFHANDEKSKLAFADTIRSQIKSLKKKNVKGWIVDLRNNDGGNMNPMLAGLEPFFSADTLGFLIDINDKKEFWGRGTAFEMESLDEYIRPAIQVEKIKNVPIAVLYGNRTGSSGEIVIISFVGNANTKSFGQHSYGLTTGNGEFMLPDESYMFFSSTHMANRNGRIYKSYVVPDVEVKEENGNDLSLEKAMEWLKNYQ